MFRLETLRFCWKHTNTTENPWWRHQMKTFSALLAIFAWNSPVPGKFPAKWPVTRSFDVFFDLRPSSIAIHGFYCLCWLANCTNNHKKHNKKFTQSFVLNQNDIEGVASHSDVAWWRHQMETVSALLSICGNPPVTSGFPPTKASDAELWCFPWSTPEQMVEQTIETSVIWDAITLIMTSL